MIRNVLIFASGVALGAYGMYNHFLYKYVTNTIAKEETEKESTEEKDD